jgi:hypothetical protein
MRKSGTLRGKMMAVVSGALGVLVFVGVLAVGPWLASANSGDGHGTPAYLAAATQALIRTRLAGSTVDSAEYVRTRRSLAVKRLGQGWISSQPDTAVYLVVVQGTLTGPHSYVPIGFADPKGRYAAFTIDATTGSPLDFSIGDHPYPIASLGAVGTIELPAG